MNIDFLISVLMLDKPSDYIRENEDKIFKIIPELKMCKNFNQNNIWHIYDVYEHILHVVDGVPNNIILRLAALFHDIGKPLSYQEDEKCVGHFYGHWNISKEIFEKFIQNFNLESDIRNMISNLILYHDLNIDKLNDDEIEQLIGVLGDDGLDMLFQLKQSDLLAQNPKYHYLLNDYEQQKEIVLNVKIKH